MGLFREVKDFVSKLQSISYRLCFFVRGNTPVSVPIYFVQTSKFVQVNRVVLDFLFVYFFKLKKNVPDFQI